MSTDELTALHRAFAALAPIPDGEWIYLSARVEFRDVPRGATLLREGESVEWLGFLTRGLVRIFLTLEEREVTLGFDCEERFVGAYDAYRARTRARYGIEALEASTLVRFERALLEELEARHAAWRELFRRLVERELAHKIDKELRIRARSAEERYAELVATNSYLVRRVPQYHLASYLGIAPETLSRIRARMGSGSVSTPRS
ncbi:MAG: Crp/Fnr family transcriptional regulator [Planctomycetes bacterium]|nr:Crp/Fnr family transcriptional regulator [Planctomycetota bacterium]